MNKRNLIREITRRSKIPENQVDEILFVLIKNIEKGLIRREKINIRDFGVFKLYFRKEFSSSLPNGKKASVQGQHIVRFIPGKTLRVRIDPSFPRVVKPKRRSIFGFLGRFASPFSKKPEEREKEEVIEVPVEKVKFQEEKVEVKNKEPEKTVTPETPTQTSPINQNKPAPPPKLETYGEALENAEIQKPKDQTNTAYYQKRSVEKAKKEKETKKPAKAKVEKIDLKNKKIDKKVFALVPEYIARLYKAVPIEMKGGKLVIAMSNPGDLQAAEFIKKKINRDIEVVGASEDEIKSVLDRYSGMEGEIEKALAGSQFLKKIKTKKKEKESGLISEEAPTSRI
ncbi:MAG: HU family DNA-binding protein [Candidatus Berkelbacteria bacterium]|nr:HU family DNA-binding protein [Candidatus Berkelbacteria bacterium]